MNMELRIWKKIGLFLLFVVVMVMVYVSYNKEHAVVWEETELERVVGNLDDVQKKLLIKNEELTQEELSQMSLLSLNTWEIFVLAYKDERPEEYKKTKNWEKKLLTILEHERKANELFLEQKFIEAEEEKDQSFELYKAIKKENGILEISDEMLAFYEPGKKVVRAQTKKEAEEDLLKLKFAFTVLKGISVDEEFDEYISKLEMLIGELDKFLDGPDFKKAQTSLEKVFMEFYMKY